MRILMVSVFRWGARGRRGKSDCENHSIGQLIIFPTSAALAFFAAEQAYFISGVVTNKNKILSCNETSSQFSVCLLWKKEIMENNERKQRITCLNE